MLLQDLYIDLFTSKGAFEYLMNSKHSFNSYLLSGDSRNYKKVCSVKK